MTRPLTNNQRRALIAVERGQVRAAPTTGGARIEHPPTVSGYVLATCRRNGWWTWHGPRAVLTAEGRAMFKVPVPEPANVLHTGVIGSDTSDRCLGCNHVRGAHGITVGEREHLDCLYAGCDCERFIAADDDNSADHGYIPSGVDRLDAGQSVDEFTQQRLTADARRRDAQRFTERRALRKTERAPLSIEERLLAVQRDAKRAHIDVSGDLWLIKRLLTEKRDGPARQRLDTLENRVEQRAA